MFAGKLDDVFIGHISQLLRKMRNTFLLALGKKKDALPVRGLQNRPYHYEYRFKVQLVPFFFKA